MKTYMPKIGDIKRDWHLIDANGQTLGRLSTQIANLLRGKFKTYFVNHLDCGDYVVVTNVDKIKVTGNKLIQKTYYRHSGFPGGFREEKLGNLLKRDATKVIERSVKGMLPDNKLKSRQLTRLKVYVGDTHPYTKQFTNEAPASN